MDDQVSETRRVAQSAGIVAETRGLNQRRKRNGRGDGSRKEAEGASAAADPGYNGISDDAGKEPGHGSRIDLIA